nr:hypothetical protein [uncultured Catonella sp.]
MNFKKTIAKSLVVAMALGMVPMANLQTAKAAAGEISFDGTTGVAKSASAKYWGIAKEDTKNGKGSVKIGNKSYKISNIQEYYEEIDAYSALKGKSGILVAGEKAVPDGDWKVLALPAAETTFKVQLVASTSAVKGFKPVKALGGESGYLVASLGKKPVEVNLAASNEAIEVKLNDGEWKTLKTYFGNDTNNKAVTKKLKVLGQNGSTLTFRLKGTEKTWASKESKLKVATQPKAPNVKIDITKETTTIKKGMEWQLVSANAEANKDNWTLSTDKKGISLADLKIADKKDVLVRTAASGKKIASKVARIAVNKPLDALTVPANFEVTGGAIKKGITNVALVETSLAYDVTKGAVLKNISKMDLEYALVNTDKNDKVKWSTLKASKEPEKKPTKANLKFSKDVRANSWSAGKETKLFVRLAGTKQTKDNVVTQSGVSAGGVMALTNIPQKFKFSSGTADSGATVTVDNNSTKAAIKVATGTAAKITVKANISTVVNPKGGAAKIKATNPLPKGVTIKAGKIDAKTGDFEITIDINKNAFKETFTKSEAAYSLQFEGVKDSFKITIEKK